MKTYPKFEYSFIGLIFAKEDSKSGKKAIAGPLLGCLRLKKYRCQRDAYRHASYENIGF